MTSIATSLGIGSGIDTPALITQLTEAQRAPREAAIRRREETNTARVSSLANVIGGIDSFATSLGSLIAGGTLFTQPTSSDTSIVGASAIAGARLGDLSAQIEVRRLAQPQTLVSGTIANSAAPIGRGTITLSTANGSFPITIDASNDSLGGLARTINAANAGVNASVLEDSNGARLVIKGPTGAAKAFTIAVDPAADAGLAQFAYSPSASGGMTRSLTAQDALLAYDGIEVTRATNSITDLVPGVKLDLKSASVGTIVTLGSQRPTDAIRTAVGDFVAAYNALHATLAEATAPRGAGGSGGGPLRGDVGIREMQRQLGRITSTTLSSAAGPRTLAEIGVRTSQDGTLSLDAAKLEAMLASDPAGVEALFNPAQSSSSPLLKIGSLAGKTKPGSYEITGVTASPLAGTMAGHPALVSSGKLVASALSPASGLVLEASGDVASATITIDAGLGGALQAIRDALRAQQGPLASTDARVKNDIKTIAAERTRMEERAEAYKAQLTRSFTTMDARVTAYKATQSYLEQQIALWTKDN